LHDRNESSAVKKNILVDVAGSKELSDKKQTKGCLKIQYQKYPERFSLGNLSKVAAFKPFNPQFLLLVSLLKCDFIDEYN
jgi:hypothetical protein